MKKTITTIFMLAFLAGCSPYHRGVGGVNLAYSDIQVRPMEARIQVGERIQGRAKCKSLFGIPLQSPAKEAYGAELQTTEGNIAPNECTRGAIYEAISRSHADIIVAPQYVVDGFNFLCLFGTSACLYKSSDIVVTGYKGVYYGLKDMDEDVVRERYKNQPIENKSRGFTSGIISLIK